MTIPIKILNDPVKRREYIFNRVGREDDQTPLYPLETPEEDNCELDGEKRHKAACSIGDKPREDMTSYTPEGVSK